MDCKLGTVQEDCVTYICLAQQIMDVTAGPLIASHGLERKKLRSSRTY